jgi:hypothetical protein
MVQQRLTYKSWAFSPCNLQLLLCFVTNVVEKYDYMTVQNTIPRILATCWCGLFQIVEKMKQVKAKRATIDYRWSAPRDCRQILAHS